MRKYIKKHFHHFPLILSWLLVVGLGVAIFILHKNTNILEADNLRLNQELAVAKQDNTNLLNKVNEQNLTIENFTDQIANIGQTVGTLEKLSQTDEELLKKYSKVYFLNENYVPAKLTNIPEEYLYEKDTASLHADVWPYMERLIEDAEDDGIHLLIASAFRSFDEQASLKSNYKVIYGAGTANQFSADQGYSEHQLGTTVDFTTAKVGGVFSSFESDPAYKWLTDNAYKYGFVLSYPKGNTYYKFEPWHWRYVGVSLAKYLHNEDKYFYDLDQREIDAYLIKLFD